MSLLNAGTYPLSLNLKLRPRHTAPECQAVMTVSVEYDGLSCEFLDVMFKHYKEAGADKAALEAVKVLNAAKELKDTEDACEEEVMDFLLRNGFYISELELAATSDTYEHSEENELITASTLTELIAYLQEAVDFFKERGVEDADAAINVYVQYHTEYNGDFLDNVIEKKSAKSPAYILEEFTGVYHSPEDYACAWTRERMGAEAFDSIPWQARHSINWCSVWDALQEEYAQVVFYGGESYIFHG